MTNLSFCKKMTVSELKELRRWFRVYRKSDVSCQFWDYDPITSIGAFSFGFNSERDAVLFKLRFA